MILFRGREQSRPEQGVRLLQKFAEDVAEFGSVESTPMIDGRNMVMVIGPHKNKSDAKAEANAKRAQARARNAPESDAPAAAAPAAEAPTAAAPKATAPKAPAKAAAPKTTTTTKTATAKAAATKTEDE